MMIVSLAELKKSSEPSSWGTSCLSPPFVSPPFVTAFLSCHRLFVTAFYRLFSSLQSQKKTWK
jgi:hypothetical protein